MEGTSVGGTYDGDRIPNSETHLTRAEQLKLLDWHPVFTGRCPNCELPIPAKTETVWCCHSCGWSDAESH